MVRNKHVLALSCLVIILRTVQSQNYQCMLCPLGKYKGTTQNSACLECPADTYQDVLGATSVTACKPCPSASFAAPASTSSAACSCAAGYSGDVANYSVGVYTENLAAACTAACETMTNKASTPYPGASALDGNIATFSFSDTVVANDPGAVVAFVDMKPWWRVKFQREAVVQTVEIRNEDSRKMQNFFIRVGNDEPFTDMNSLALCAGPLTWTQATSNTYTCNAAVRGQYMYIINGYNAPVVLSEVKARGYLQPATEACVRCAAGSYKILGGPGACTACVAGKASADVGSIANTCVTCLAKQYSGAGAATCVNCPGNSNSNPGSTGISSCGCTAGYTPIPPTVTCSAFQALYLASRPWAHYTATLGGWDVANKMLNDVSGNNRNIPLLGDRSQIVQATTPAGVLQNGVSLPFTYIKGSTYTSLFFPVESIPAQFTICSVTRYGGTANQNRILTNAGAGDWLHGHVDHKRGVAYYGSRDKTNLTTGVVTPLTYNTAIQNVGTETDWMVMCSKNGGSTPKNVLIDGVESGTSSRSDSDPDEWGGETMERATQLCINCKEDLNSKSDWELAQLLIWNTHLSDAAMKIVSDELRSYLPLTTACTSTPSNNCTACAAGKFKSSSGGGACVNCGTNTFQPFEAAISSTQCQNCPLNANAPAGSMSNAFCICKAGYSNEENGGVCSACPRGSYKTDPGVGTCTQCPANYFSTTDAQTTATCSVCPANSQSPAGSDEPTDCVCDAGYTGANGAACLPCVSGTYKTAPGAHACTQCGNDTYSSAVNATMADTCVACQGNSVSMMGSDAHTDCHCLPGFLTNDLGRANATCTQCSAGSFNPALGATTCSKCAGGFHSSSPGAVAAEQCLPCPTSKYSAPGAAQCEACPLNTFAPALSDELTDCTCLAGYYSTTLGQDGRTCQACPAGTFKRWPGAAACTECPVNRYSTALNATSNATCQACIANAVSPASSSASSQCLCDLGYYKYTIPPANWARSCGVSENSQCTVTGFNQNGGASFSNLNDGDANIYTPGTTTNNNPGWLRIDFGVSRSLSGVSWLLQYCPNPSACIDTLANNFVISIGDGTTWDSAVNKICKSNVDNGGPYASVTSIIWKQVTCDTVYAGRYMYLYRYGALLGFPEFVAYGVPADTTCISCTAGTFKDTVGSAACTTCPANYYSGLTARTSNATCTSCYENSVAPAGSVSMDACSCVAGYEFT